MWRCKDRIFFWLSIFFFTKVVKTFLLKVVALFDPSNDFARQCNFWCFDVASVFRSSCMSLNYDVVHSFDVFAPIVKPTKSSYFSTRVGIVRISCCTKPNSGVAALAIVSVIPSVTNSCPGSARAAHSIETFFDAVALQRDLWTDQCLVHVLRPTEELRKCTQH